MLNLKKGFRDLCDQHRMRIGMSSMSCRLGVEGQGDQGGAVLARPGAGHEDGGDGGGGQLGGGSQLWGLLSHQRRCHWVSSLLFLLSHLRGGSVKIGQESLQTLLTKQSTRILKTFRGFE